MKEVSLEALGLCEHCNVLLSLEDMPIDSMDAVWSCSRCGKETTHQSFGYNEGAGGAQRIRWVGPNGTWTDSRPEADFQLGQLFVVVTPLRLRSLW